MFNEEKIERINKQIAAIKKTVYYGNYVSKKYKVVELKKLNLRQIKGLLWKQASVMDKQRDKIANLRVEKIDLLMRIRYFLKNDKKESNSKY